MLPSFQPLSFLSIDHGTFIMSTIWRSSLLIMMPSLFLTLSILSTDHGASIISTLAFLCIEYVTIITLNVVFLTLAVYIKGTFTLYFFIEANKMNPNQTAPLNQTAPKGAVRSGSIFFFGI